MAMASTSGSKFPSSPPKIPTPQSFSYDVFLNFRGADTRNNFTGHLYDRLVEAGIHTFMDDSELRIGEVISQELMTAIEESRIYIVVFSENYASSRWCLDELVKILECGYERIGRVIIPVFYKVKPSQVRGQGSGSFAEAFQRHKARYVDQLDMVMGWRNALFQAANISGFDLQRSALGAEIEIRHLKDRCLLLPDNRKNELRMHDLLRDMGREIVRQQSPRDPCMRSRLWIDKDVSDVLRRNTGTEKIEGVALSPQIQEEVHVNTNGFARMRKLRLLQMANVNLNGSFEHISEEIRWICWKDCSLEYLPSDLHSINLVALDMQHSKMSRVWQGIQFLGHLKILNLSHSEYLTSTPDFETIPRLVTLVLEGCTSLVEIHPSIGCLVELLYLNLKGCKKITDIPSEICSLRLLGYLNLNGCSNLIGLPDDLWNIKCLRELYADETAISQLPRSFVHHKNLTTLSLKGCNKISPDCDLFVGLWALRRLNLRDCNLFDEDILQNFRYLSTTLQELDLAGNSLRSLPSSFTLLTNLESLWLDDWTILQALPQLPPNLEALLAKNLQNA